MRITHVHVLANSINKLNCVYRIIGWGGGIVRLIPKTKWLISFYIFCTKAIWAVIVFQLVQIHVLDAYFENTCTCELKINVD